MKRDTRRLVQLWALSVLALVLAVLVSCSASARQKAINATFVTAQASSAALVSYDAAHQQDIVAGAPDKATGETQLAAWRENVRKVHLAIDTLYRAIAAAAILNDDTSLKAMLAAAAIVGQELEALGLKIGGGS